MGYDYRKAYIERKLAEVSEEERPRRRLELDLAHILTGPTCGATADRLAASAANDPMSLAIAMRDAATRYLQSVPMELKAGDRITVRSHASKVGEGLTYNSFSGVLSDYAGTSEGWDVVDVKADDGETVSIYCFSIER